MKAYWTGVADDCDDYEAEITTCVYREDSINIIFSSVVDGDPVQGRLSLSPVEGLQKTTSYWVYVDSKKEKSRFSERENESLETKYTASVVGHLQNFIGKEVVFEGTWDEQPFHGEEGGVYNFEIDARIT